MKKEIGKGEGVNSNEEIGESRDKSSRIEE